jgi:hypothetical protein
MSIGLEVKRRNAPEAIRMEEKFNKILQLRSGNLWEMVPEPS